MNEADFTLLFCKLDESVSVVLAQVHASTR